MDVGDNKLLEEQKDDRENVQHDSPSDIQVTDDGDSTYRTNENVRLKMLKPMRRKNTYHSAIDLTNPKYIIVVVGKRSKPHRYCVSNEWIDYQLGYVIVPKLYMHDYKLSETEEDACLAYLIENKIQVMISTLSIPSNLLQSAIVRKSPAGHFQPSTRGGTKQRMFATRTLVLTWNVYPIHALMKDFRK